MTQKASILMRCCALVTVLFAFSAKAGEIIRSEVAQTGNHFSLNAYVVVHAPMTTVQNALTDYEHLRHLNSGIISSKVLSHSAEDTVVEVINRDCILFFCQRAINTQRVTIPKTGYIRAVTIPSLSDFHYAKAQWYLTTVPNNATGIL